MNNPSNNLQIFSRIQGPNSKDNSTGICSLLSLLRTQKTNHTQLDRVVRYGHPCTFSWFVFSIYRLKFDANVNRLNGCFTFHHWRIEPKTLIIWYQWKWTKSHSVRQCAQPGGIIIILWKYGVTLQIYGTKHQSIMNPLIYKCLLMSLTRQSTFCSFLIKIQI